MADKSSNGGPHVEKITENMLRCLAWGAIGNAGAER